LLTKQKMESVASMNDEFLFGDSSGFAIRVIILPHNIEKPNLKLGKICMVCDGEILGDFETVVLLNTVAIQLEQKLKEHDKNISAKFFTMERHDLIDHVEHVLLQCKTYVETRSYESLFLAPGPSEAFDGEVVVWLENYEFDRLVWRRFGATKIKELFMPSNTVTHVIKEFIEFTLETPCSY